MKNLYSIPAYLPFADVLAQWILANHGGEPLALPRVLVLLPSRRACLSLREAFLRATGGNPTLLPRMQPLGEVDEDRLLTLPGLPPAIALATPHPAFASKRLFLLAQMVRTYHSQVQGKPLRMDHAVQQAHDIARLLDQVEREGARLAGLAALAPENFSAHWQLTTEFLNIVAQHWPAIAAEQGLVSPEHWRGEALRTLSQAWEKTPPDHPVIAAGTTGSIAATALLKVIATMPQGSVVLPGLDTQASTDYMEHVSESHPQWGMLELLRFLGVARDDVSELGAQDAAGTARTQLLSLALAPAEMLAQWRASTLDPQAVAGLALLPCADEQEEAVTVSLLLREVLETPAKTAALVTHDRALARRVAAEMLRFNVQIDDSAGQPLAETPAVAFLRLVLQVAQSNAAPVKLLALLKHPLAHAGMERAECLEAARELEMKVLRGICPAFGLEGLREEAKKKIDAIATHRLLKNLEERMGGLLTLFASVGAQEFSALLETHIACAEALAGEKLWQGREAEALAALIDDLRDAAPDAGLVEIPSYPSLFDTLLAGKVVRPEYGMHPRLKILSPIEARMQSFDRIITGGMNEGNWPPLVGADPWFNRPMRASIGLAAPERQTGQAAHDFMMLASAPEVFVTRAEKAEGSPTTPARWWVRLFTLLDHYVVKQQVHKLNYMAWARQVEGSSTATPCERPRFAPPLQARPSIVAVTSVETWLADPYAFYAAKVLGLRALEAIDKTPDASDFGNAVHKAMQRFTTDYPEALPADAYDALLQAGAKVLEEYRFYPVAHAWWWPRFEQIALWMVNREKELRPQMAHVWAEVKGSFALQGVTFTGRADRIEQTKQGGLAIVDYKTGGAHSKTDTREGRAVQLMLMALIAQEGRWENNAITAKDITRLEYWIAGGGRNSGEIRPVSETQIAEYAGQAKDMLTRLIAEYKTPAKPYVSAATSGKYNDYKHLSRLQEWR